VPSGWSIRWDSRALKDAAEVPMGDRRRIVDAVEELAGDPLRGRPLKGRWKGLRRIKVGPYRVIYSLRRVELTVRVLRIGHRKEVYR